MSPPPSSSQQETEPRSDLVEEETVEQQ